MNLIRVRHDLPAHAKALLATLGFDYVVDPDAPECALGTSNHGGCPECRRLALMAARQEDA